MKLGNVTTCVAASLLCLSAARVGAEELVTDKVMCVVIHEKTRETAFELAMAPVVSFVNEDVKLVCGNVEVCYPLAQYLKMTIEEYDTTTEIRTVPDATFSISDSQIIARGQGAMSLYTVSGQCLDSGQPDEEGVVRIPVSTYKTGAYVIKTEKSSFKILKK